MVRYDYFCTENKPNIYDGVIMAFVPISQIIRAERRMINRKEKISSSNFSPLVINPLPNEESENPFIINSDSISLEEPWVLMRTSNDSRM